MSHSPDRRRFLTLGAALAAGGALPDNLKRALAIPPDRRSGTIRDVEHVVILMQENRSFDHYFGCLRGVRGYGDPRAERQPDGTSVFSQPDGRGGRVMPFRLDTAHTSSACLGSLDHSWKGSQTLWADWNVWVPRKTAMTMGHFTRAEIPYYYALADAFTICDAYHASIFGPTNPNRLYLFSGTSGLAVGNQDRQVVENVDDGNWCADMAHDRPGFTPFSWSTYPEKLQAAGVTWRVYQEYDNFGDNPLASFAAFRNQAENSWQYQNARRIVPGSNAGNMHDSEGRFLIDAFERDVAAGTLPQISWIVPSQAMSEHPDAPPGYGEMLISRLMDVFVRHPRTWSKTVFILNYDENDGFFDHVPPPVPALAASEGASTVSTWGESFHGVPVGLGPRVPAIVVSPWTKGGWVNSQVFDHVSVLLFLEARFGVEVPHVTPWRRAVVGDLTSVFDFAQTDTAWTAHLPDTEAYLAETRRSCALPGPVLPLHATMPRQETGQRPARALPYALHADLTASGALALAVSGRQGAVFRVRDRTGARHYTLAAGDAMRVAAAEGGPVTIHGPCGFFRSFDTDGTIAIALQGDPKTDRVALSLHNHGADFRTLRVTDAYARAVHDVSLPPDARETISVPVLASDNWYDLTIAWGTATARFAGHLENGRPSRSDPAMATLTA